MNNENKTNMNWVMWVKENTKKNIDILSFFANILKMLIKENNYEGKIKKSYWDL